MPDSQSAERRSSGPESTKDPGPGCVRIVGIVPAAGAGSRLCPARYPKELLPVAYVAGPGGAARHVPVVEVTLRSMALAGIARAVVVVAPGKTELCRVLGDGAHTGVGVAYVVQETPRGLVDAVRLALPWADADVCLGLPDTVFEPLDAHRQVCEALRAGGADVVLGVFPTDRPGDLGPVAHDAAGRVQQVQDKPATPVAANTWGLAAWRPAFTRLLAGFDAEAPLGLAFDAAVRAGLDVQAVAFPGGRFHDVGTPEGLGGLVLPPGAAG